MKKDDRDWYQKLKLHYYLTEGKSFYKAREQKKLVEIAKQGEGEVFKPVVSHSLCVDKIAALEFLEITQFIDSTNQKTFTADQLMPWYEMKILPYRCDLELTFGIKLSIQPNRPNPIAIANQLLKELGLHMPCLGQRTLQEKRVRVYSAAFPAFIHEGGKLVVDHRGLPVPVSDKREAVFAFWLTRDRQPELSNSPLTAQRSVKDNIIENLVQEVVVPPLNQLKEREAEGQLPLEDSLRSFSPSKLVSSLKELRQGMKILLRRSWYWIEAVVKEVGERVVWIQPDGADLAISIWDVMLNEKSVLGFGVP